jgi:hypothetical protein
MAAVIGPGVQEYQALVTLVFAVMATPLAVAAAALVTGSGMGWPDRR